MSTRFWQLRMLVKDHDADYRESLFSSTDSGSPIIRSLVVLCQALSNEKMLNAGWKDRLNHGAGNERTLGLKLFRSPPWL